MSSAARDLGVARSFLYRIRREVEECDVDNRVSHHGTISIANRTSS
jgi:hypothetical protein